MGDGVVLEQGVDEAFEHVRRVGLPGVNPADNHNVALGGRLLVADGDQGQFESPEALAEGGDTDILVPADGRYILLQLGVCVGNGIGKINLLVLLLEVVLELQLVFDEIGAVTTQSLHELYVIALALSPLLGGG